MQRWTIGKDFNLTNSIYKAPQIDLNVGGNANLNKSCMTATTGNLNLNATSINIANNSCVSGDYAVNLNATNKITVNKSNILGSYVNLNGSQGVDIVNKSCISNVQSGGNTNSQGSRTVNISSNSTSSSYVNITDSCVSSSGIINVTSKEVTLNASRVIAYSTGSVFINATASNLNVSCGTSILSGSTEGMVLKAKGNINFTDSRAVATTGKLIFQADSSSTIENSSFNFANASFKTGSTATVNRGSSLCATNNLDFYSVGQIAVSGASNFKSTAGNVNISTADGATNSISISEQSNISAVGKAHVSAGGTLSLSTVSINGTSINVSSRQSTLSISDNSNISSKSGGTNVYAKSISVASSLVCSSGRINLEAFGADTGSKLAVTNTHVNSSTANLVSLSAAGAVEVSGSELKGTKVNVSSNGSCVTINSSSKLNATAGNINVYGEAGVNTNNTTFNATQDINISGNSDTIVIGKEGTCTTLNAGTSVLVRSKSGTTTVDSTDIKAQGGKVNVTALTSTTIRKSTLTGQAGVEAHSTQRQASSSTGNNKIGTIVEESTLTAETGNVALSTAIGGSGDVSVTNSIINSKSGSITSKSGVDTKVIGSNLTAAALVDLQAQRDVQLTNSNVSAGTTAQFGAFNEICITDSLVKGVDLLSSSVGKTQITNSDVEASNSATICATGRLGEVCISMSRINVSLDLTIDSKQNKITVEGSNLTSKSPNGNINVKSGKNRAGETIVFTGSNVSAQGNISTNTTGVAGTKLVNSKFKGNYINLTSGGEFNSSSSRIHGNRINVTTGSSIKDQGSNFVADSSQAGNGVTLKSGTIMVLDSTNISSNETISVTSLASDP